MVSLEIGGIIMGKATLMATDVPGIGAVAARSLSAHGFDTARALAAATVDALAAVPGFGPARAARVKKAAADLVGAGGVTRRKTPAASRAVASKPAARTRTKPAATAAASAAQAPPAAAPQDSDDKPGKPKKKSGKDKPKKGGKKDKSRKSKKDKRKKHKGKKHKGKKSRK